MGEGDLLALQPLEEIQGIVLVDKVQCRVGRMNKPRRTELDLEELLSLLQSSEGPRAEAGGEELGVLYGPEGREVEALDEVGELGGLASGREEPEEVA